MGAGAARGAGAHLLAVNEGVAAVLPARCDAARAPHCCAQAECRVAAHRLKKGGPQAATEGMQHELLPSEDAIDDRSEAWSVLLGPARLLLTAMGGGRQALKTHLARLEHHGEQLTKIEGAGSPHHPGSGGGAPRLARWRAPDCWAGEAATAGSSPSRFCAIGQQTSRGLGSVAWGFEPSSTTCNWGIWRIHFHHYFHYLK